MRVIAVVSMIIALGAFWFKIVMVYEPKVIPESEYQENSKVCLIGLGVPVLITGTHWSHHKDQWKYQVVFASGERDSFYNDKLTTCGEKK